VGTAARARARSAHAPATLQEVLGRWIAVRPVARATVLVPPVAAACYTLAAPPYEWWPAAWLVPGLVLVSAGFLAPWLAALTGAAFGFLLGPGLAPWLVHATLNYFGLSRILATAFTGTIWFLFGAVPYGILAGAYAALQKRIPVWTTPLLGAWLWTLAEWLRSTMATGLPWELLGHTQFRQLAVVQIADLGGVYAVSFLLALTSLTVVQLLTRGRVERRSLIRALGICAAVVAATLVYGVVARARLATSGSVNGERTVAVVQANIPSDYAWQRVRAQQRVAAYARLSFAARSARPDLIVWPENAADVYLNRDPMLLASLAPTAALAGEGLVVGAPRLVDGNQARNAAYLVGPHGAILGTYDKRRLVPIAEYDALGRGQAALGEPAYRSGAGAPLLDTGRTRLGAVICYEILFPGLVRDLVRNGAEVLVNISNDSWLDRGDGQAPQQHFSMGVFRAIESRRFLVRAATTGVSGFVTPTGEIFRTVPTDQEGVAVGRVALRTGETVYVRWGDRWLALPGLALLALIAPSSRPRRS
jgi:apolipoprotein N-acyltransferase